MQHIEIRPPEVAREVKFCELDLKSVTYEGLFEGYAALFNRADLGRDVVVPGAFRASLDERGAAGVRMLFQHDPGQPIGVWTRLHEDARGLYVRGRIMTDIAKGREVLALMRAGAIDGLSIGFRAIKGVRDARSGIRRLEKIDLWEISIVTFPMQPEARIGSVKGGLAHGRTPTQREFERWLTQDAGFTRSQARALMRDGFKGLDARRDAGGMDQNWQTQLARRMSQAAQLLRAH